MSAYTVAKILKLHCQFALLLSALLSATLLYGAESNTNASSGKMVWTANFESNTPTHWSLLEEGGAQGALKLISATNSTSGGSNALQLIVTGVGERCGLKLGGFHGVQVQSNQWYDLAFRARTEKRENDRGYGLTVSLESPDGKRVCARTTIPEVGGEWRDYTVALQSRLAQTDGVISITVSEPGAIWFDDISLSRRQTGREMRTP